MSTIGHVVTRPAIRGLAIAASLALALPAAAGAATPRGTVLSVSAQHHVVEVVGAAHAVHGYRYAEHVLPRLAFGSQISYRSSGSRLEHVRVLGRRASAVSFYGRVASSGTHGLTVRLSDGTVLRFGASALTTSGAGGARVKPGERTLFTETREQGRVRLTVSPTVKGRGASHGGTGASGRGGSTGKGSGSTPTPTNPWSGTGGTVGLGSTSDPTASGVVTNVGDAAVTIQLPNGSSLTASLPTGTLSYLNGNGELSDCETVAFNYHEATGGAVLDRFTPTGVSVAPISESLGDTCADESDGGIDVVGSITAMTDSSVTLAIPGTGSTTFGVDPSQDLLDGDSVGDVVDVTYTSDPLSASDVEYVEEYTTGTVTSVDQNAGTLTITDATTGQTDTFSEGESDFSGVTTGEAVGVSYYVAGGELLADDVESLG